MNEYCIDETKQKTLDDETTPAHTPTMEWIIGGLGFVLVLGAIGYLLWQGLRGEHRPPKIVLKVEAIEPVGESFLVRVRAINQGGEPVKSLMIEGTINSAESSTMTFDNLPADSERLGGLFFTADPRQQKIKLRAHGYEE